MTLSSSQRADIALLRRFEPVIRYTKGEKFFPMEVDAYVRESSLWVQRPRQEAVCLVPEGELTLEKLAEPRVEGFDAVTFLKFIEPMNIVDLAAYRLQKARQNLSRARETERFRAGRGRLARVGYVSRLVDALFSITLLARGRVSGDTAAASAIAYEQMMDNCERYVYYGRVVRQNAWTVLQYWYFYPFNSWRSGFFGVNDHEADWEMACIYLWRDEKGELKPEWVALASHDFHGDDLRRRWDDPGLKKEDGCHPVIYAGAGSHAGYYLPGEYLAEVEIPFLARIRKVLDRINLAVSSLLKQRPTGQKQDALSIFHVPFVDYARGDGLSIGSGQVKTWTEARLLDPPPGWVKYYRGLWGVYVRDPISGENAPAGPMYDRDGSVRRAWYDPVGWAGLDKVPTPGQALAKLQAQLAQIEARCRLAQDDIKEKSERLVNLGVQADALREHTHLKEMYAETQSYIYVLSHEIDELRAQIAQDRILCESLSLYAARLESGERSPVHAHLHHPHYPSSMKELRVGQLAEGWAAISVGLMMVGFVTLVVFARHYLAVGVGVLLAFVFAVEATFRRQFHLFVSRITAALAVFAALVLIYDFFWTLVILIVLLAGGYLMVENLRELFD